MNVFRVWLALWGTVIGLSYIAEGMFLYIDPSLPSAAFFFYRLSITLLMIVSGIILYWDDVLQKMNWQKSKWKIKLVFLMLRFRWRIWRDKQPPTEQLIKQCFLVLFPSARAYFNFWMFIVFFSVLTAVRGEPNLVLITALGIGYFANEWLKEVKAK